MPKAAKAKETKDKLLKQGLSSFLRSGYNGTGLKEVLDRVDIDAESLASFFWDAWEGSLLRMKVEQSTAPLSRTLTFLLDDFFRPRA